MYHAGKRRSFRIAGKPLFCKQGRARKPHVANLKSLDVSLQDGALTARIEPTTLEHQTNVPPALIREIPVYQDGILHFKVDEEAVEGKRKRFQVPDVLVEDVENNKLWLQRVKQENKDGVLSSVFYLAPGYEGVLQHDPFQVYVRKGKKRLISFNSKGLFHFEQLRQKNEEENWEESFHGHTDSRPHGPQSISLDVSFHGAKFVYGIPEHAAGLALKPTRGPKVESEPYRLFNLDVFEYIFDSPFGLYGSVPFMISHAKESMAGFFWLNAAELQIDVMAPGWDGDHWGDAIDTYWMAESGIVDGFFFLGPNPKDVIRQYTSLIGTSTMPQHFATTLLDFLILSSQRQVH